MSKRNMARKQHPDGFTIGTNILAAIVLIAFVLMFICGALGTAHAASPQPQEAEPDTDLGVWAAIAFLCILVWSIWQVAKAYYKRRGR